MYNSKEEITIVTNTLTKNQYKKLLIQIKEKKKQVGYMLDICYLKSDKFGARMI